MMEQHLLRRCSTRRSLKRKSEQREEVKEGKRLVVKEDPNTLNLNLEKSRKAIFILDQAPLRKALVRKRWKILDSEEDKDFLLKQKMNLNDCRPDIVYKALLDIFDSPICKAGMVGAVYVKIGNGILFEIKPHVRIPRTCKRFCGLMLELLQKSCIRSKDTHEILIHAIEEPVTRHLPANSRIIGLSYSSEKLVHIDDYIASASDDFNLVFVVGTMVHGEINKEYTEDFISGFLGRKRAGKQGRRSKDKLYESLLEDLKALFGSCLCGFHGGKVRGKENKIAD